MQGLEDVPTLLADLLEITDETAQVLLSVIVIFAFLLPTMYLARGTRAITVEVAVFFLVECLLVGMGWLPFWVLIATIAIMAVAVALLGTRVVTGD